MISNANVTAIAHYIPASQDTGGLGIPDWFRLEYFGTTDVTAALDSDKDTLNLATEYFRGYHPRVHNELVEGGISRRRSETLVVITSTNYSRVTVQTDPAGITNSFSVVSNTTSISLPSQLAFTGYGFIGWFNGTNRVDSPQGFSIGNLSLTITNDTTFTGKFLLATQDLDTDGILDAYEWYHFNTNGFALTNDVDGDGLDIQTEIFRGYSPQAHNDLVEGGISRRRSETLVVITTTNSSRVTVETDPIGITNSFTVVSNTTSISLPAQLAFTDYGFIGWFNGTNRVDSPRGFSIGNLSLTITNDTTFTGKFLLATQDLDADGMLDAYEWYNFNTNGFALTNDVDGDGLDIQTEIFRGYSPQARNELLEGGISRRRSETLFFIPQPPDFALQPAGSTNLSGTDITLTAEGHGIGAITYQWRLNGVNITGATNATLTLTNAYPTNSGSYSVAIRSPYGANTSILVPVIATNNTAGFILPMADDFPGPLYTDASRTGLAWNEGATRQPGEPFHADKPGTNSVWLHWRAPVSGIVTLSTLGSGFDTLLAVYTGSSVAALTRIASDEDSGGYYTSALAFSAAAGEDYYFAVDGLVGAQGHIILSWQLEPSDDELPRITAQPASRTVAEGARVPLQVQAVSRVTPNYQWFKNGIAVANANRDELVLENIGLEDVGVYNVAVWIGTRTNWSEPASIQISNHPDIVAKDKIKDLLVTTNDIINQVFGTAFNGASLTVPSDGRFALASLPAKKPVGLMTVPVVNLSFGSPINLIYNNSRSGSDPGEVQGGIIWNATDNIFLKPQQNGYLLIDSTANSSAYALVVSAPTAGSLASFTILKAITNSVPGQCRLVVPITNGVTYNINLCTTDVTPVQYTNKIALLNGTLQIIEHPVDQLLPITGAAQLKVIASAQIQDANLQPTPEEAGLTYQWLSNSIVIPGANQSVYAANYAGGYSVIVTSPFNSVTSSVATVSVGVPPVIIDQPKATNVLAGRPVELSVTANGEELRYQWYHDGVPIAGARGASHLIDIAKPIDQGTYKVMISNPAGELESVSVALTVQSNRSPQFTAIADQVIAVNLPLQLTITATDADSPPQILQYRLLTGPANSILGSYSGEFSWTPEIYEGFTTNQVTIEVKDDGLPSLTATQTFTIIVSGQIPTAIPGQIHYASDNGFQFMMQATPGRTYAIEVSTDFIDWSVITNVFNATGTFQVVDPQATNFNGLFYRSLLLPP
ncbi:MAG TPA: hypothetical protein VGH19_18460 [Verrucomicrobiae bacterium]